MGAFAADPQPTSTTHTPPTCSPNLGGSVADPDYDNPSFSIFNTGNYSQSPSLTLALLLEAWPVNSYPYVVQLPSGSVFVAAGQSIDLAMHLCLSVHSCVCVISLWPCHISVLLCISAWLVCGMACCAGLWFDAALLLLGCQFGIEVQACADIDTL